MGPLKAGDQLIGPSSGDVYTYIGELDGKAYLRIPDEQTAISFDPETLKGWDRVVPFFEEDKIYVNRLTKDVVKVLHVQRIPKGLVALVLYEDGDTDTLSNLTNWIEQR
jgi:hypothetical protein